MFEQSKYEVDMINNPKNNLLWIMKWIDLGDRQVLEMLNRRANKWIEARVKNMTNMLNYSVKHPWDMAKYNEMIVNGWFNEILDQINTQTKSWVLKMTNANLATIKLVQKQINNLK